jgi:hypothetical protein
MRDALRPTRGLGSNDDIPTPAGLRNDERTSGNWLKEKDYRATDRRAADAITERFPETADIARANRAFLHRAVRFVAGQGVTQFVDLGMGLPASPTVHETAQAVNPGVRVHYVERDLVVPVRSRALLSFDEKVGVPRGDIREPGRLLADMALNGAIDNRAPVCVLLVSVLHFLTSAEADLAVAMIRAWMPPGSYLVISGATSTGSDPEFIRLLQSAYRDTATVTARTAGDVEAWFEGLNPVRPGLVDVWRWRPDGLRQGFACRARFLAGVGRKPSVQPTWMP